MNRIFSMIKNGVRLMSQAAEEFCAAILFPSHIMAYTGEGQGTALLLPTFSQKHISLMAGRGVEQGTAPSPLNFTEYHRPVLADEVVEYMAAKEDDVIVDGTLGGGGHSELLLESGACVVGIDRDPDAIAYASNRLAKFGEKFSAHLTKYSDMLEIPQLAGGGKADGILMDLGVSSHQLDQAERGFSFQKDGPLDMRMGPNAICTAADYVNDSDEATLIKTLREFGEEAQARRIAQAICKQRSIKPFTRTAELASCVEKTIGRSGRTHPATKTFQAIRMAVNEELEILTKALRVSLACLKPGGRLLLITFHSLEDRIVKQFFHHHSRREIDDPTWASPRENPDYFLDLPVRKAITATVQETKINPRARSAKLRVAVRNDRSLQTAFLS